MASWPRSSTRSSTAIMSSAPTSRAASSNSMRSSGPFCATNWSPTISPTSACARGSTISTPCGPPSRRSRIAGLQAEWLNVHVDFPLLQRLADPITIGAVRYPGLKIHEPRIIRLFEVLLHGGPQIGGWTARQIHQAVLDTFDLSENTYRLNQLRYDLRKLKGHGLIERDGSRYAYRLSPKGVQVALLFLFFHKRLCGPLANSRFHHRPDPQYRPHSR